MDNTHDEWDMPASVAADTRYGLGTLPSAAGIRYVSDTRRECMPA